MPLPRRRNVIDAVNEQRNLYTHYSAAISTTFDYRIYISTPS